MKITYQRGDSVKFNKKAKGFSAVAIALLAVGLMGSPATADTAVGSAASSATSAARATPGFRVYFSPNCANASRYYSGPNGGEYWINDTFNAGAGLSGYGQKIRNNAASVRITDASVYVASAADMQTGKVSFYKSAATGCYNLEPSGTRNNNVWFAIQYHVG
jgi:hypothetical protein